MVFGICLTDRHTGIQTEYGGQNHIGVSCAMVWSMVIVKKVGIEKYHIFQKQTG